MNPGSHFHGLDIHFGSGCALDIIEHKCKPIVHFPAHATLDYVGELPYRPKARAGIKRDPGYDLPPSGKLPAILDKKALWKSIGKYGEQLSVWDQDLMDQIRDHVVDKLTLLGFRKHKALTIEQAVEGVDGLQYINGLKTDKAPGYPWILERPPGVKGRAYLMDQPHFWDKVMEQWRSWKEDNEISLSIWTVNLKDEKRPAEKVLAGKTRTFISPASHMLVNSKRVYDQFNADFYRNHNQFFSAVGMNMYQRGWDRLYRNLRFDEGFDGDYSNWDATMSPQWFDWAYQVRAAFLDEADHRALRCAYQELVHSYMLIDGHLYQKHQGNPDGGACTAVDNTLVNYGYFCYAWMKLAPPELRTLEAFDEHVSLSIYGDDNVVTVSRRARPWFTHGAIQKFLAPYGITYTMADKHSDSCTKKKEDLTFLSVGFQPKGPFMVPKIPARAILSILEFTKAKNPASNVDFMSRAHAALTLSWTDDAMYTIVRQYIARRIQAIGDPDDVDYKRLRAVLPTTRTIAAQFLGLECMGLAQKKLIQQSRNVLPSNSMAKNTAKRNNRTGKPNNQASRKRRTGKPKAQPRRRPRPAKGSGGARRSGAPVYQAMYKTRQPRRGMRAVTNRKGGDVIITDEELLTTVLGKTSSDTSVASRININMLINPLGSAFAGTKLANMARNFERYKFTRLSLHYVPGGTLTATGQLIGYYDLNPTTDPATTDTTQNLYRNAAAHRRKRAFHPLEDVSLSLPISTATNDFFLDSSATTEADVRTTNQARFVMVQNISSPSGTGEIGSLYVRYTCVLKNQQLSAGVAGISGLAPNARGLLSVLWENTNRAGTSAPSVTTWKPSTALLKGSQVPVYTATSGSALPDFIIWAVNVAVSNGYDYGVTGTDQFPLLIRLETTAATTATYFPVEQFSGNLQGFVVQEPLSDFFVGPAQSALVNSNLAAFRAQWTLSLSVHELEKQLDQLKTQLMVQSREMAATSRLALVLAAREQKRANSLRLFVRNGIPDLEGTAPDDAPIHGVVTDTIQEDDGDQSGSEADCEDDLPQDSEEIGITDDIDGFLNNFQLNLNIGNKKKVVLRHRKPPAIIAPSRYDTSSSSDED